MESVGLLLHGPSRKTKTGMATAPPSATLGETMAMLGKGFTSSDWACYQSFHGPASSFVE